MRRMINRVWADPIAQWCALIGGGYSAYVVWQTGQGWLWVAFWGVMFIRVLKAIDAERRASEFDELDDHKPSFLARLLGHPVIAWPIILAFATVSVAGVVDGWEHPSKIDGAFMTMFCLITAVPLFFLRLTLSVRKWRRSLPVAAKQPPAAQVVKPPVAQVVLPTAVLMPPSVPDAMRNLPPGLLDLVKEGMSVERARRPA